MSIYGVPVAQCEPIRNRRRSPLPTNRFLDPDAVIAEGIKGRTLPPNVFSIPSRSIGGRIRKISQYSVRSEDDVSSDDGVELDEASVRGRHSSRSRYRSKTGDDWPTLGTRSLSANDLMAEAGQIPKRHNLFLTVPGQDDVDSSQRDRRDRSRSLKSASSNRSSLASQDPAGTGARPKSISRRKSLPTNLTKPPQRTSPSTFPPTPEELAVAGAGATLADIRVDGLGENEAVEDEGDRSDSPSPATIQINVTEDNGRMKRISRDEFEDTTDSELNSCSPPTPPLPPMTASPFTQRELEEMRRVLKFFFMDPIQKWKAKRRFPWKLCLQLLKIVFVTIQLYIFGCQRSAFIVFTSNNKVTFQNLYLQDWDPALEGMPYPPPRGPYAVYDKDDFFSKIDFAVINYYNTSRHAVGVYAVREHTGPIQNGYQLLNESEQSNISLPRFCITFYPNASVDPSKNSYQFPQRRREDCLELEKSENFSIISQLNKVNASVDFKTLINATLQLQVKTVHLLSLVPLDDPTCYLFDVNILFDNSKHSGEIPVTLTIEDHWESHCNGKTATAYHQDDMIRCIIIAFDVICVSASVLSLVLCLRSVHRAILLRRKTEEFFLLLKGAVLSKSEKWEFINVWYLTIILNDVLTIIGSIFKISIEIKAYINWNLTGLTLGISNLLVWVGVLRYLSFFSRYNILIVTLKHAMPDILRFLVCSVVLFFGFVFCGWTVLGPYNLKFRSFWSTMMCLFALINGDDMYVTFTASSDESNLIWYFSQLYLYAFISLFIYVNISLFTAVILDSYSLVKYYYQHGFPKSDLFEFIDECLDEPEGGSYRKESTFSLRCRSRNKQRPRTPSTSSLSSMSAPPTNPPITAFPKTANEWRRFFSENPSLLSCFRCACGKRKLRRRRAKPSGTVNSTLRNDHNEGSNFAPINSDRQQLVSDSDDDTAEPFPGTALHI